MSQFVVYPKIALSASLGQQTMAASMPVVIASNQSAVAVSISGTVPLPTGAATEATLAAMSLKLPATLGQKAMAASMAVVLASDQSTINVAIPGTVPLPTGAATEATLAAMSLKLPAALGQLAMAASMSVAIASDQSAIPVSQSGTWNITNVSGTVSLPTGAATAVKQPALGTAGTASADVISIQGIASMTPVRVTQTSGGSLTDRSGSTSGTPSTSTQVAASNASRRYFFIENLDISNSIYINFTSAASAASGSIKIVAGASFVMEAGFCSTEAINVLAAVASVAFTAKEG